jgi:hypothetical protein
MVTLGTIGASGVGLILAVIAFIQWRKSNGAKSVCWMALISAMLLSGSILSWLGILTQVTIFGIGIMPVALVASGLLFYHEVIKGRGLDYIRSPLVAIVLGVSIMAVGGTITGLGQQATNGVVHVVNKVGTIGGGG